MTITAQMAFDRVWQHFIVEKNPYSYSGDRDTCMYRGENGAKCAFGIFIPDEQYRFDMEGKDAYGVMNNYPEIAKLFSSSIQSPDYFLPSLQNCHDNAVNYGNEFHIKMEIALKNLAKKYELTVPS